MGSIERQNEKSVQKSPENGVFFKVEKDVGCANPRVSLRLEISRGAKAFTGEGREDLTANGMTFIKRVGIWPDRGVEVRGGMDGMDYWALGGPVRDDRMVCTAQPT